MGKDRNTQGLCEGTYIQHELTIFVPITVSTFARSWAMSYDNTERGIVRSGKCSSLGTQGEDQRNNQKIRRGYHNRMTTGNRDI